MKTKILLFVFILAAAPVFWCGAQAVQPTPPDTNAPPVDTSTNTPAATTNAPAASTNSVPDTNAAPALPAGQPDTTQPSTPVVVGTAAAPAPLPTTSTNADEPSDIGFDDLPLPDAIRQLAVYAGLNIQFDHKLDNPVDPVTHQPVPYPTVKERWKNLTALQAIQALLDKYDWQMKRNPNTPVVMIGPKEANAVEPQILKVILLAYSDPTNIVQEVNKVMPSVGMTPDVRTHKVIVRTTEREMPAVENLISNLDSSTGQILIEAKIIETTKDITSAKGIDWTGTAAAQHVSFGNGITSGTVSQSTQTGTSTGTTATGPSGRPVGGSLLATTVNNSVNLTTPIIGSTSEAGGFSLNTAKGFSPATAFLNADGVSAVLSFLNSDADTKSIAFPRTVSLDGRKTTLAVIQNVPIFEQTQSAPGAGSSQGLATVVPNYNKSVGDTILNEVGVKLTVTPRIAGPSNVLITVQPEISSVDTKIATDTLNGQVNTSPIFDRRVLETQAAVPTGYTLVLGGLDNDILGQTLTKVPGLGDLPGIGSLFRSNTRNHTRNTILIFVTPTIIRDSDFQPTSSDFLRSRNEPMPTSKDTYWDSAQPRDWTKPKSPVEPAYQP
jgi:type II secretory pathway component GspD/PulD (secretin)